MTSLRFGNSWQKVLLVPLMFQAPHLMATSKPRPDSLCPLPSRRSEKENALSGSKSSSQDTTLRQKEKLIWFYWWLTANFSKQTLVLWKPHTHQSVRLASTTGVWDPRLCSILWFSLLQATLLDSTTQNSSTNSDRKNTMAIPWRSKPESQFPKD